MDLEVMPFAAFRFGFVLCLRGLENFVCFSHGGKLEIKVEGGAGLPDDGRGQEVATITHRLAGPCGGRCVPSVCMRHAAGGPTLCDEANEAKSHAPDSGAGKEVERTAQDVEELTKNVDVVGKREALLSSSAAADEATKVFPYFFLPPVTSSLTLTLPRVEIRRAKRSKISW